MKYVVVLWFIVLATTLVAQEKFVTDNGKLTIHLVGHGSLYFDFNDQIIHVDPWSRVGDYDNLQMPILFL